MGRSAMVMLVWLVALPAAAQDACDGEACGGHGECMIERDEAFCFCDEGYAAEALECVAAPDSVPDESARMSSSIGARIVRIASAEGGRRMGQVGRDLDGYPGRLSQWIKVGALWCTDFVAWAYRAAGLPFTGGYHGGWHLPNNIAVRRWYQRAGRWVANGSPEWSRFTPRPGDYLRFHTNRYGHSAIVRYVAGDTLYTVEGNSRSQVRLRRYPNFRNNQRIDGFGIMTNPEARVALLRRSPQQQGAGRRLDGQPDERRTDRARP